MRRSVWNAAVEALRTSPAPQCIGRRVSLDGTGRCVLGVIAEAVYGDVHYVFVDDPEWPRVLVGSLVCQNDGYRRSFAEVADRLERFAFQYVTVEDLAPEFMPAEWELVPA